MDRNFSTRMLGEMKQFASFSAAEQRFIRRSLDVGLQRGDVVQCWSRDPAEAAAIESQVRSYRNIAVVRGCVPDDDSLNATDCFLTALITMTAADLAEAKLRNFEAYSFLYERLLGAEVRPWLVSTFCAAAALPSIHPTRRKALLESIPLQAVATAGWSARTPLFYPKWVDKVPEAVN